MKNNIKKAKTKKKILKQNTTFLIILIILAIIVIYAGYKVIIFIKNPTDTFSLEQGSIYEEERSIGYIIREETVTKGSNYKNGMEKIKSEGEKVAKGEHIFRYYSNGESSLIKKIQDLDQKIEKAMSQEDLPFLSADIKTIEKQIEDQINSLYKANDMQTVKEIKKQISENITKKAKIAGTLSPAGSYLKKLIDERSTYENQLNKGVEYLSAPVSGVVSYKVDGYEEVLTPNDFSKLSADFLEKLGFKTGQVVADSTESAKIINNFECYIACILNSKQAKEATVGDNVKIRLPNNDEVTGQIVYISNENDELLIVFRINRDIQSLISYRKISFDIIWWSATGKKVPNESIAYEQKGENQIAYVCRTRAGYTTKIWVKVLKQNEKHAIIENYTETELAELGFSSEEIRGRGILSLYDEIYKKSTQ